MNECLKCGQAGMRYVTHACMTAGAVLDPPLSWINVASSGATLESLALTEKEGFEPSKAEHRATIRNADNTGAKS